MKPKKRQKLCYNCDGEIDLDVIVCPFCAADLREAKPEEQRSSDAPRSSQGGAQHMSQSLYPPPYGAVREDAGTAAEPVAAAQEAISEESPSRLIMPILLFALGVQLFLLGFLMVLFSAKGALVLKWDARFWFLYLFASIPFLIFGYRSISKL